MKVGIVYGTTVNKDGSLPPHTKARADAAIEAYECSIIDTLIVSGRGESDYISQYIKRRSIERVLAEYFSYSTLSNTYFSRIFLEMIKKVENEEAKKLYLISNEWHLPRIGCIARNILSDYNIYLLPAYDPRNEEEKKKDIKRERVKFILNAELLLLGYGRYFEWKLFNYLIEKHILSKTTYLDLYNLSNEERRIIEELINLSIPSYQKLLMRIEKKIQILKPLPPI